MAQKQRYDQSVQQFSQSQDVSVERNCYAYSATNLGDTTVLVNGMRLFPSTTPATVTGDSISVSGHKDDIYKGKMKVVFLLPLGANPLVEIVQLFYAEDDQNVITNNK